eukprot:s613_g1.t3
MRRRKKKLEDEAVSVQEVVAAEEVEATCCTVEAPVQECLVQILLFCPGRPGHKLRGKRAQRALLGLPAFVRDVSGLRLVYIDPKGEALSTAKEFSLQKVKVATWSPNGQSLAFVDPNAGVSVAAFPEGEAEPTTTTLSGSNKNTIGMYWSPLGTTLVTVGLYQKGSTEPNLQLWRTSPVRKVLASVGEGSVFRGWRQELDRLGVLEVGFQVFCSFAERHHLAVDAGALFGHARDEGHLVFSEICPKTASLLSRAQAWVKAEHGSVAAFADASDGSPSRVAALLSEGISALEEEKVQMRTWVETQTQKSGGRLSADDLLFLEGDRTARRSNAQRLRVAQREERQRMLAAAFCEEHRQLPSTHRLAPRPWQASAYESLPGVVRERRGKWKKAVRRRERQIKELFLTHLKDICGTVVRAWRTKLDPENPSARLSAGCAGVDGRAVFAIMGEELLRVRNMSGEEILVLSMEEVHETIVGDHPWPVLMLKRHLQHIVGYTRYRQRLVQEPDGVLLKDWDKLSGNMELQLILVPFIEATTETIDELRLACGANVPTAVECALQRPYDPDAMDERSSSALCTASLLGHSIVIALLLEARADVDMIGDHGASPLMWAAVHRHVAVTRQLLQARAGVDVESERGQGATALLVAAEKGHADIAEVLLEAGADPDKAAPLVMAACEDRVEVTRALIKGKANIYQEAIDGSTPLLQACSSGSLGVARVLLEARVDPNRYTSEEDLPLIAACEKRQLPAIRWLLKIRADVNKCNKEPGLSPLTMACLKGHKDVRLLLHKKADKEKHVSYLTPLVAAARDGQVDIIRLLVKQRADIDTADGGWTALRIATQENQVESARALLKLGADKHRPSKDGFTASQLAYFCLHPDAYPEIRSLLLESVPKHLIAPTVQTATFNASPFHCSTVSQAALKRYSSKAAVQLDFVSLWRSLDLDGDGEVGLEALAPAAAETLAGFKQWAVAHYGSCALFWASPMLIELRKAPQRQGRWRSDKKMLLSVFVAALRDAGAIKRGEGSGLLGSSLDSYGCGFVCHEDFVWLDGWRPVEWLTATPNQEEWAIMKALLTRVEGHPLKAWRKRLDKDDSNAVSWVEFRSAFEELHFRGDIAGAWRYVDTDMSGCISLKEYDPVSADLLHSFKAWAERFFGSVGRAFAALDSDGSGTVSRHELRKACQKRCWAGDVDMLFNCLDVDEGSGHRATLDVCEVSFLDNWDEGASESEDERPEHEPQQAPPSQRSASSSVRPPPRAASPPRSASARAEPARSPILEAAAQSLLRRCPPEREMRPPRPRPKQKDPEQWAQERERQAKSIYRNLAAAPTPALAPASSEEGATSQPSACAVDTALTFSAAAGILSISAAAASPTLTQLYTPASPRSVVKLQTRRRLRKERLDQLLGLGNWINDPNGPFRDPVTGMVHLWMQYNPHGADWGSMSWYHTVSRDYVHWQRLGPTEALTFNPVKYPYASGGFYSGSVTLVNGSVPVILYTCVSGKGQDPYQPQTATVVGYSGDAAFKDWKFDSVIFEDRYVPYGMFECPDLFELPGGVWVLKVSTMVVTADYYRLGSRPRGTNSRALKFQPNSSAVPLDYGDHYYASKSFFDPILKARIIFAWSSEAVASKIPHMGWAGVQTLPRVMVYDSKHQALRIYPLPALEALRQELLFSSSRPKKLVDMEPLMLVDASGDGTAPVPPGLQLQQEVLASFTFPDLFDTDPGAFVGLLVRQQSAKQYSRIGIIANPLGGHTLKNTDLTAASYTDLPMDLQAGDAANAQNCSEALTKSRFLELCVKDLRCVAWTYVRKNSDLDGSFTPRCSLKGFASLEQRNISSCCTSGFVKTPLFLVQRNMSGGWGDNSSRGGRARILPDPQVPGMARMDLQVLNDPLSAQGACQVKGVLGVRPDAGLERLTTRLYLASPQSGGVSATVSGTSRPVTLLSAQVYALGSIWTSRPATFFS